MSALPSRSGPKNAKKANNAKGTHPKSKNGRNLPQRVLVRSAHKPTIGSITASMIVPKIAMAVDHAGLIPNTSV